MKKSKKLFNVDLARAMVKQSPEIVQQYVKLLQAGITRRDEQIKALTQKKIEL